MTVNHARPGQSHSRRDRQARRRASNPADQRRGGGARLRRQGVPEGGRRVDHAVRNGLRQGLCVAGAGPRFQPGAHPSEEKPDFVRYLIAASGDKLFAEGGGKLIRDDKGDMIGAVGVTGDTEEHDEELAVHGIHAAGLKTDTDFEGQGRQFIIRRSSGADGR
jgi:hypothetical protein